MPPRKKSKTTKAKNEQTPATTEAGSSKANKSRSGGVARRDRNLRGKRGGLESMPNLPLDVLIEIFGFIHPRDLLSLARTTREFRDFLMSRNAISFWKEARKQVIGLPDPPPGVSEPAYANFLFFNQCHGCLKGGAHLTIYWNLLVRYCSSCKNTWLVNYPHTATAGMIQEFGSWARDAEALLNSVHVKDGRYYRVYYHKPEVDEVAKQWNALRDCKQEERRRFVKERHAIVEQRRKTDMALKAWNETVKRDLMAEQDALKDERLAAVLDRLREEGWGEEVDKLSEKSTYELASLDGVNRPTKLTERGWKSIRDAVLPFMEKVRAIRLEAEYSNMIQNRLPYLKSVLFEYVHSQWLLDRGQEPVAYAGVPDCALFPEVRAILADPAEGLTKESIINKLAEIIPTVAAKWMEERKAEYLSIARAALGDSEAARAPELLDLAIVAFRCSRCSSSVGTMHQFPQLLHDGCLRQTTKTTSSDPYERAVSAVSCNYHNSVAERLYGNTKTMSAQTNFVIRREVIEACGMNPDTATIAEMDACEARLRCRLCATLAKQEIHTWRTAIKHDLSHHRLHWQTEHQLRGFWERVPEEFAAQARAVEVAVLKQDRESERYLHESIRCTWCWTNNRTLYDMKQHMSQRHDIVEPQKDVDWCLRGVPSITVWMYAPLFSVCEKSPEKAAVDAGTAFFAIF
ncbi:hypothetical protein OH76DRAFT_1405445 [Lentinus brumalis]|uniref:F-box domain-containing protein n=1 Tax=Lentinus brumalis TaxID=2498619 RepID=A0A371D5S5_9APHY|nr:hypothetical protein OH76DRAFT_1405445 [Polyporus brumalis]